MISLVAFLPMTRFRFFFLAVVLALVGFASAADKPRISLDEFFNYVDVTSVQISPDGNSFVIAPDAADWDRQIFETDALAKRTDSHGGSLIRLTESGHESKPRWAPDGKWIAFPSERKSPTGKLADAEESEDGKDSDKDVAQVYLISPSGGEAFPITSGEEEVHSFAWSANSKTIYFATRTPWNKVQKDAYQKIWKDTVQYREGERGDILYSLDLQRALDVHAAAGTRETPKAEKEENTTLAAHAIAKTPWRVHQLEAAPDGRRLVFVTTSVSERQERVEEFEVYSVDLANALPDTPPRPLTHNEAFEH